MKVVFSKSAWEQYVHWQETDARRLKKINALLKDCLRNPFEGIGQPEPLKHDWAGWWSRRIDKEHRLVYRVAMRDGDQVLEIAQCRSHY
jgi:toxin YoeB